MFESEYFPRGIAVLWYSMKKIIISNFISHIQILIIFNCAVFFEHVLLKNRLNF